MRIVTLLSGGLGSLVLAHHLKTEGHMLSAVILADGLGLDTCRVRAAQAAALYLNMPAITIDLSPRNPADRGTLIMIAHAASVAIQDAAYGIALGVNAEDAIAWPDCRPEFFTALSGAIRIAASDVVPEGIKILTPLLHHTPAQIVRLGADLGINPREAWSCDREPEPEMIQHCGRCPGCIDRRAAFYHAGLDDLTVYRDDEYARPFYEGQPRELG